MRHYNLASERTRLGMNQTELSEVLLCSVKSIVKWEKDISTMPGDKLKAAAHYFGCSLDYLVDETDERVNKAL